MKNPKKAAKEIGAFRQALEAEGLIPELANSITGLAFQFGFFGEYHPQALGLPLGERQAQLTEKQVALLEQVIKIAENSMDER